MGPTGASSTAEALVLSVADLDQLIQLLKQDGRTVIGPTVGDGVISYEGLAGAGALPAGVGDEQSPGHYRLRQRDDVALFGYALAPASWKRHVFPPRAVLFRAERRDSAITIEEEPEPTRRLAFIGVRACELAAMAVQRGVLLGPANTERSFAARTGDLFIVAVSCGTPAGTCFCVSAGTGPVAADGYDIRLTEVIDESGHRFVADSGSTAGALLLGRLNPTAATPEDLTAVEQVNDRARNSMGRTVELADAPELLARNLEHPRWDDVAARCLACGNCTMACPTCFCTDTVDENLLDSDGAVRARVWASCFGIGYSDMHGGTIRTTVRTRYRQWLTHKMSYWVDQFDTLGCVGCGRCITLCPVGIDITEELTAIRATDGAGRPDPEGRD